VAVDDANLILLYSRVIRHMPDQSSYTYDEVHLTNSIITWYGTGQKKIVKTHTTGRQVSHLQHTSL